MSKQIKIALLMASSLFMEILDGTIVTTALPKMTQYFHTSTSNASLLISLYMVTVAIFIPMSGWLANYYGKKRIWIIAVLLFTLSSLGSALSPTMGFLIFMRVIQGFSGAMMTPTARLIVFEKVPANQILKMASFLVWPALIAPAIAPIIGGFIVTYLSWHWIFAINLPIGIIALLIGRFLLPKDNKFIKNKFDWVGFIEIALASGALVVGAELSTYKDSNIMILGLILLIVGVVLGYVTYRHLLNSSEPLFSISALKIQTFRINQTSGSVLWLSVGAMPYLLTIFLQNVFHWSAITAGGYVIFIFLGNVGIKPFTTRLIRTLSYRGALLFSFVLVLFSSIALFFIKPSTFGFIIMTLAFISGVGRSLALTAFNGLYLSEVDPKDRNSANTLNAVTSSLSQGLGVSVVTLFIHLMNNFVNENLAYSLGFVLLGLMMIYPIVEIYRTPKSMGKSAL